MNVISTTISTNSDQLDIFVELFSTAVLCNRFELNNLNVKEFLL